MGLSRVAVVGLVGALLASAHPAIAGDPDASDPPRSSGPLVALPYECEDNGPARPSETQGQSCSWTYELAPVHTEPQRQFSAYWIQMEIDPADGECALELMFELEVPDSVEIISASAERNRRISQRTNPIAELVVDAGGAAPVPGTVSQQTMVETGRETVDLTKHSYSYTWTGTSKTKVMLAIGVQLAYRTVPPEFYYEWSEGYGMGWGSCRPMIIRVGPR